jgi:periplasmic protein TonB
VQKQASFPGGDKALKEYLTQHLKYLQQQQNTGELVVLNIIVNEKGMAEDLKIVKPEGITISPAEVEAVLKQMPAWTPGKQSGKPLSVSYTFPVRF